MIARAKEAWQEFQTDKGIIVAAAVSFYTFLSIFPLILAAIGIGGLVTGANSNVQKLILDAVKGYAVGSQAQDLIENVVRGSTAATGIGLLVLLWSGTGAVAILMEALNVAWDVDRDRGFVKTRLLATGFALLMGLLLLISIGATAAIRYIFAVGLPVVRDLPWIARSLGYIAPLVISITMFTLMYKILPNTNVPLRIAVIGGVFAGLLWEVAKVAFAFYVNYFADYNKVYGSIGSVILMMIWINYSAIITILGAELASSVQRHRLPRVESTEKRAA